MLGYALSLISIFVVLTAIVWYVMYKTQIKFPTLAGSVVVMVIVSAIFIPTSYSVTKSFAQNSAVGNYKEYWNGWEKSAVKSDVKCTRDGSCVNEYKCDREEKTEWVTKWKSVPDGKGGSKQESYQVQETKVIYHDCPYSKVETSYYVNTSASKAPIMIAGDVMTGEEWRPSKDIPGGRQGDPQRWLDVQERTRANRPAPATAVHSYDNYLLGSQDATFKRYEGRIEGMRVEGLLPTLSKGVFDYYHATKFYAVGNVSSGAQYADDVERINGAFGSEFQGDLHVVMVPSDMRYSQTEYIDTLMAYWQSAEMGKLALSKNTLVVVLAVDGTKVVWADARTGMPVGNQGIISEIQSKMIGVPLDKNMIGSPSYDIQADKLNRTSGALEVILWGDVPYERVSMSADDINDKGMGFKYLMDAIQPSTGSLVLAGSASVFFGMIVVTLGMFGLSQWSFTGRRRGRDGIW